MRVGWGPWGGKWRGLITAARRSAQDDPADLICNFSKSAVSAEYTLSPPPKPFNAGRAPLHNGGIHPFSGKQYTRDLFRVERITASSLFVDEFAIFYPFFRAVPNSFVCD